MQYTDKNVKFTLTELIHAEIILLQYQSKPSLKKKKNFPGLYRLQSPLNSDDYRKTFCVGVIL